MNKFKKSLLLVTLLIAQNAISQNLPADISKFAGQFSAVCSGDSETSKINFVYLFHNIENDTLYFSHSKDNKFFNGSFVAEHLTKQSHKEKVKMESGGCKLHKYSTKISAHNFDYVSTRERCFLSSGADWENNLKLQIIDANTLNMDATEFSTYKTKCVLTRIQE